MRFWWLPLLILDVALIGDAIRLGKVGWRGEVAAQVAPPRCSCDAPECDLPCGDCFGHCRPRCNCNPTCSRGR